MAKYEGGRERPEVSLSETELQRIVEDFRAAHATWAAMPENGREIFNMAWLQKNGYSSLRDKIIRKGGALHFASMVGGDVQRDFKKILRVENRTPESVIEELRAAHAKWKAQPEAGRGKFGPKWLVTNVSGLNAWMQENGGSEFFISKMDSNIQNDFERMLLTKDRTPESAIEELRVAHAKWKAQSEGERGRFSPNWLAQNAAGLFAWMKKNGGYAAWIAQTGGDVEKDFEVLLVTDRTTESAIEELRAAHAKWKALPEEERGKFSPQWLQKNYGGLHLWLYKRGGLSSFVTLAGGDVEKDFEKERNYGRTPESAIVELRAAHAKWKALPVEERGKFNTFWLYKNSHSFEDWARRHGGAEKFVALAGGDVSKDFNKKDFNREQIVVRTPESVVGELRAAHAKWKALPEEERGKFGPTWIARNTGGLIDWIRRYGKLEN